MTEQKRPEESFWPFVVFFLALGVILWGMFQIIQPRPVAMTPTPMPEPVAAAPTETPAHEMAAGLPSMVAGMIVQADIPAGDQVFHTVCFACHGFDARGIAGLGKPLIDSEFINTSSDEELVNFVIRGRDVIDPANTTGVAMPPRGGSPTLSDQDIVNVVAYIRSLNAGTTVAAAAGTPAPMQMPTSVEVGPFVAPDVNALDPSVIVPSHGASGQLDLSLPDGQSAYVWFCSGCHGVDGRSIAAADLSQTALDDSALLTLLTQAVPPAEPGTAFAHPARGGYPPMTDEQVQGLIAYLSTLQG